MIKRTLYIESPAFLHTIKNQLVVEPEEKKDGEKPKTIPIEDIGIIILDNDRINVSKSLLAKLQEHNAALVVTTKNTCL